MTNKTGTRNKKNKNSNKLKITLAVSLTLIVVCCILIWSFLIGGSAPSSALVKIPVNANSTQLRDTVAKYLGDGYAAKVSRLVSLRGTDLKQRHGAYLIEAGWSPFMAMRRLTGGPQYPLTVTINGFRLRSSLEDKVSAKFDFTPDSLSSALENANVLEKFGLTPEQSMSLFFNDSYDFFWSASPEYIVKKVGEHYLDVWNDARREKAATLGLTPADVMILASIVDEETNAKEEKGTIGRLYINRLKLGMPLQADPTVRFAGGDFSVKRITSKMTKIDHPYNTYKNRGLPPGPIRTTSVETVDAILDSEPNEFIYMCAKEDFSGRHNFARTYAEHEANARRYKRELDRRGIF